MMGLFSILAAPGAPGTVSLLGETVTATDDYANNGYCGIRVNTDGTIDKITGDSTDVSTATFTQIDSATDWITPNAAGTGYHVRFNTNSGDALDVGSSSAGAWIALTSNRLFYFSVAGGSAGAKDHNADLLLSRDGGTTTLLTSAAPYIFDLDDL